MESQEQISMVELEDKLRMDQNGTIKKEIASKLEGFLFQLKGEMDKGLSPDEFLKAETIKKGIEYAIEIINKF
ncbi:EscE/YscE/SsaE family type III secretion system needle protein co-chaperone [Desulfothermus sp.]